MSRGVLVTGGNRGIGASIAAAFRDLGDDVVALSSAEVDLADPAAIARAVAAAVDALGSIDVLVNNAGLVELGSLTDKSYEQWQSLWRRTFDVNVFGAADMSYCVARHMIERGVRGRIVNVGSRGAFRGEPDMPAYGASKAALHSMGQSLAVSLAPHGIAVASVAPGFVATDRVADLVTDDVRRQSPFGRVARPEEVAAAVVYLASPQAEWASGAVLDLNGASYLRT
ncbi:SDR family NAD(P)-dependent oxidoreductase [Saccharothrix algeriensis]|uniref:NAD(P)-dependent dehydrogenase (Short-subunit alcohol dehydrogenase family) n=1 Tax=Saccharothrix algeriensis TaxID=173560 RepID=A0A8T8HXK6_9PSEU|nr:SDR family oxidoreductase [Saccharothrix algeriensis]MBM7814951.1 NAD(P)-dependent dehydrogenase (short-subunit alcohol dehydrogenase family) [Saccharothrix algeriensis]QTR03218.1 SDR family oxidoreductase [Saccharothrix algeriensis]